ncbi:unnamed protein product [Penicillium bialowiezense]
MKDCQCSTSGLLLIVSEPCNQLFGGTEESTSRPSSFDSKGFFDLPSEQGNPLDPSSQGLIPRYSGSIEGRININEPIDEYNTQAEHYQAGEHAFIPCFNLARSSCNADGACWFFGWGHICPILDPSGHPSQICRSNRHIQSLGAFRHEKSPIWDPKWSCGSRPTISPRGPDILAPPWGMQSADQGGEDSRLEGGEPYREYMMDDDYGSIPVYEGINPFGDCLQDWVIETSRFFDSAFIEVANTMSNYLRFLGQRGNM